MKAMLLAALLAPPQPEQGLGLPRDVSVDGWHIDWLIKISTVFIVILFVIMVIWLLYSAFRHDEKHHKAIYDHGDSRRAMAIGLGVAALVFFVVDGNLFVNSTIDLEKYYWNFAEVDAKADVVRIEINAHQWAWDARYAGPDGKFSTQEKPSVDDVITLNDIRVPVDTPVLLQLSSGDVIHSFYLPNFRVKQDVMPGQINRLWFQAKEIGEYDIGCAQHCGTNHYKMKGRLTVLSKEDFQRWLKVQSEINARAFDPTQKDQNWGWAWKEI